MAEHSTSEIEAIDKDPIAEYMAAIDSSLLREHNLFSDAITQAEVLGRQRFDTPAEANAAAGQIVTFLDQTAGQAGLLSRPLRVNSPEIWTQKIEPISTDSEDILLRAVRIESDESLTHDGIAIEGDFYGFIARIKEDEERVGVYCAELCFQIAGSPLATPFLNGRTCSTAPVSLETQLLFNYDRDLLEIKNALMQLAGKGENGENEVPPLVNVQRLSLLVEMVKDISPLNLYNHEALAVLNKILTEILASANEPSEKEKVKTHLNQILMKCFAFSPEQIIKIITNTVLERPLTWDDNGPGKKIIATRNSKGNSTTVYGAVLAIDFLPEIEADEEQGILKPTHILVPHLVVLEKIDPSGEPILDKDARLRFVPFGTTKYFGLIR